MLLQGDGGIHSITRADSEPAPIDEDWVEIPPLTGPIAFLLSCVKPAPMSW